MSEPSFPEVTKTWLGILVSVSILASGFLAFFTGYILLGTRVTALETAHSSFVSDYQKAQDKSDVRFEALSSRVNNQERDNIRTQDSLAELKGLVQHLDGRLSGVVTAKGQR